MNATHPLQTNFNRYWRLTTVLYWALIMTLAVPNAVHQSWGFLLLQILPLLALLPDLLSRRYRAYSWLCFLLLLYFIFAVEASLASNASPLDHLSLGLIVATFISSMLCARYAQRVQKMLFIDNERES